METCAVSDTKVGKDGIIIPKPMESRQMVMRMKINADFEFNKDIGKYKKKLEKRNLFPSEIEVNRFFHAQISLKQAW